MWPFSSRKDAQIRSLHLDLAKKEGELSKALKSHLETLDKYEKGLNSQIALLEVVSRWSRQLDRDKSMSETDQGLLKVVLEDFSKAISEHCQHKKWVKTDRPDPMFPGDWYHQCEVCGKFDYEV
ncbi:hypothetical protein [Xanthomonas phage X1]|nr:hypothetical protein [Xanthomonas phage X1]